MTKYELAKKLYSDKELDNLDFAIPQEFLSYLHNWNVSINFNFWVMDYNQHPEQLVNLAELYYFKFKPITED